MIISPLEQFKILPIIPINLFGSIDISFTNSSFISILITWIIFQITLTLTNSKTLINNNFIWFMLKVDQFITQIINEQVGKVGIKYKPLLFTIALVILLANLIGMIPYSFTITSHPVITMGLSFTIWLGITFTIMIKQKLHFFNLFIPSGVPTALLPLIFPIEIISYLTRPISLGIRLAANMFAGHTLLNILSFFIWQMYHSVSFFAIAVVATLILLVFVILEIIIAFLQTYVFTVLVASYLNDIYSHH
jgi:ATP synthase subunit 6